MHRNSCFFVVHEVCVRACVLCVTKGAFFLWRCLCSDRDAGELRREREVWAVSTVERVQDQNEVRLLPTPLKIGLWLVK